MPLPISLTGKRTSPVRGLNGFKKSYKLPDDTSASNESFVARIAANEMNQHLEAIHGRLRKNLDLKRKDLRVNEARDGVGSISTSKFEYSVAVSLDPDDPSAIVWLFEVNEIVDPNDLLTNEFQTVFTEVFDTVHFRPLQSIDLETFVDRIEEADDPRIELDYDMNVTYCNMTFDGIPGQVRLTETDLSLNQPRPTTPKMLLESFFKLHNMLVAANQFEEMDLGADSHPT